MSATIIHSSGEQGPLDAGQMYGRVTEEIAMDAIMGRLPDEATKERFFACDAGIRASARRMVARLHRAPRG